MKDFYKVLGVSAAATLSEIKAAHRSLSKKLHPDVNNGSKFFEEKFREIQEAYEVLSDTVKRTRYDLQWKSRNADDIPPNKPDNGFSGEKEYPIAKTESKQRHSFASWAIWAFFLLMIGVIMLLNIHHAKNNENRILSEKEAANFYSNKKDERKRITDSISKILGRIFLYTNDSMATAFWSDDIVRRYTSGKDDISFNPPVFQKRESNLPFLVRLGDDSFSFGYSFTYHNSNTKKRLYFISYDNKDKLHRDTIKLKRDGRPAEEKWITGWGIGFTKIEDISTTLLDVPHLWTSVNLAKEVDGFLISMAGVEKDNQHPGLNLEEFMKSVRALNKILKKSGVDTTRFRLKIFTGLDSLPRYVRTHTRAAGESFLTDPIGLQVLFGQALLSCAICSALTPNVSCNSRATLPSGLIGCTRLGFTRR